MGAVCECGACCVMLRPQLLQAPKAQFRYPFPRFSLPSGEFTSLLSISSSPVFPGAEDASVCCLLIRLLSSSAPKSRVCCVSLITSPVISLTAKGARRVCCVLSITLPAMFASSERSSLLSVSSPSVFARAEGANQLSIHYVPVWTISFQHGFFWSTRHGSLFRLIHSV